MNKDEAKELMCPFRSDRFYCCHENCMAWERVQGVVDTMTIARDMSTEKREEITRKAHLDGYLVAGADSSATVFKKYGDTGEGYCKLIEKT